MSSSPLWPTGSTLPSRSTILAHACGISVPTVLRRVPIGSSVKALKHVGLASVSPYDDVNSLMPSFDTSCSIRYRGTGAPAMIPVRSLSLDASRVAASGSARSVSNMAGTPCSAVHCSSWIARIVAGPSNTSAG